MSASSTVIRAISPKSPHLETGRGLHQSWLSGWIEESHRVGFEVLQGWATYKPEDIKTFLHLSPEPTVVS